MAESLQLPKIEVFNIDSIEQLADRLPHRSKFFTLFLAWNAPVIERDKLMVLFQPLVDRGLVYFCAWGNRCEEVHDAVDMCIEERQPEAGQADYMLMTTWHQDEPLEEALWFFKMLAIPSENHVLADFERFSVAVGNPEWAGKMERELFTPESEEAQGS
jgi:hypothetical protein